MKISLKTWVENNSNLLLVLALLLALFIPGMPSIPAGAVFFPVGSMIYFSCVRLNLQDLRRINLMRAGVFYIFRFLLLPFILYVLVHASMPEFGNAVLLLSLMPAGAGAAAVSMICGGNATLAMGHTVISSVLAPLAVAAAFAVTKGSATDIDVFGLIEAISALIFIPSLIYFGLARNFQATRDWTVRNSKFGSVVMLVAMVFIIVVKQRDTLLSNPAFLISAFPLLMGLFAVYYIFGWFFPAIDETTRISQTVCSGAMNNGMALGLAAIYFSPETSLTVVLADVVWVLALALFEWFLKRRA